MLKPLLLQIDASLTFFVAANSAIKGNYKHVQGMYLPKQQPLSLLKHTFFNQKYNTSLQALQKNGCA